MNYSIEVYDTAGRRVATYTDLPLLELVRTAPDDEDRARGLFPDTIAALGPGYRIRAFVDGVLFCDAVLNRTAPEWSDTRKLIFDEYIPFQRIVAFEARGEARAGNTNVTRAYTNREIGAIARDAINSAAGPIHYWVDHTAYPDGAVREYDKFQARRTNETELEVGGIAEGQWVGGARIDFSGATAKDGDTIAELVVDGEAWPEVRLMLIDAEESSLNSHAVSRHPEVADWTDEQYDASAYKQRADAATAFLQSLIDAKGIDYIELNPHRNVLGEFDDRIDAFGRYLGLVYGGGECFNAALVEQGLADVFLFDGGKFHVPELALKEFYSYAGVHTHSISPTGVSLTALDVNHGVLDVLTALAYAAGGFVFDVDPELGVHFHRADTPHHVVAYDPVKTGVRWGADDTGLGNFIVFAGNPFTESVNKTYARGESIDAYTLHTRFLNYFSITVTGDADKLVEGLLDDLAYPRPDAEIVFHHGATHVAVGDLVELRGAPVRRLAPELASEWDGRFTGRLVGRVTAVRHRFFGRRTETIVTLGAPLRSVSDPLGFIVRSQPPPTSLFEFRLDDATVGLDLGFHLD